MVTNRRKPLVQHALSPVSSCEVNALCTQTVRWSRPGPSGTSWTLPENYRRAHADPGLSRRGKSWLGAQVRYHLPACKRPLWPSEHPVLVFEGAQAEQRLSLEMLREATSEIAE
eukprot:UN4032